MPSRAEERAPRESEPRTPDTGASDQFSDATAEPAETTDAPAGQPEGERAQGSSGRDSGDSWDWAEENIVPEGLRSER